jgi:hypothetical protein
MVDDDYLSTEYLQNFTKVLEGDHTRIWVGLNGSDYYNVTTQEYHFFYPWSENGTSWLWPGYHDVISMENLTYMLQQFDEVIYPTNTEYFGMPVERNDSKVEILIFNIRDELYWSPETAPFYIAGYFSPSASQAHDRNIIHIDTYEWLWRLGPNPPTDGPAYYPHQYEGTVAHEFEHLIHSDMDSDELLWVDEGCADFAGYLCGYGFPTGHIEEFLLYFWDESLTMWEGYLSDYGASFMFIFYMNEHYGGNETISTIVAEQANGIEGINNVLNSSGYDKSFDQIFQDWTIANYLDDTTLAEDGIYGYFELNIPSDDTEGMSIQLAMYLWNLWYGDKVFGWYEDKYPTLGYPYPYGVTKPYTVNYIIYEKLMPPVLGYPSRSKPGLRFGQKGVNIMFDGREIEGVPPYSGEHEWYSNLGNWQWNRLGQELDIPEGGANLTFWTYYEIEEDWDYGYVEVHDLTGDTWATLPGLMTTTTLPHVQDNPNVPPGFEPEDYFENGTWNALTGLSGDWYQEVMDLTPFANHTIELYFTYWTDGAWIEAGYFIDDIEITGVITDDVESGADDWISTGVSEWYITDGILQVNDFKVNFVQEVDGETQIPIPMSIDTTTQAGSITIPSGKVMGTEYGPAVMIIANQPGVENLFPTGYIYYAQKIRMPARP